MYLLAYVLNMFLALLMLGHITTSILLVACLTGHKLIIKTNVVI